MGSNEIPLPPSEDAWLKPPSGYKAAKPGTILRLRVAPGVETEDYGRCEAVYNILFATTDSHYEAAWGVTTVFVPSTASSQSSLLSYQGTYNTVNPNSSPSTLVHRLKSHAWSYMVDNISEALQYGWYVNFPDHEGPRAGFGNGLTTGHTTIDSIRAVLHAELGMKEDVRIALWGFSGGAIASAWATELQPHYAPELRFHGAALGGLPPSLECCANLSGTPYAALILVVLLGTTMEYPEARRELLSLVKEEHQAEFLLPLTLFIDEAIKYFLNQDIWTRYFKHSREHVLARPLIRKVLVLTNLGNHGIPETPLFIYKAIHDQNTPIEDTDALVERWGYAGCNIRYERNTIGGHVQESANGRPRVLEFLTAVLAGAYTHEGVTVKDVTIDLASDGSKATFDPVERKSVLPVKETDVRM